MATIATVPAGDEEELRLALVMNGGVSLAIWIGGVAMEINRLVRGDGVYGEVLEMLQSTARVDVIAGASAGGINGALLAMAVAHDRQLESLRKVWLDQGSLAALFRSPFQADPPSLMKGDEYFLERLKQVFRELATTTPTRPETNPIRLTMTNTTMRGERVDFEDDFGTTIHEVTHRGQFNFRRDADRDDFASVADADRLALAARCTASFPGAFEASFVPIGETTENPERPDMTGIASFTSSRFTIDGGVLVNKPMQPVLRAIFAQPAEQQVRRVLAYVIPDPGAPPKLPPQKPSEAPSMARVILDTVSLPRQETVAIELDDLKEHNRRVRGQRRIRDLLLGEEAGAAVDFVEMAGLLFPSYRDARLDGTVEYILDQLTVGTRRIDAAGGLTGAPPRAWSRRDLREALGRSVAGHLPRTFPAADGKLAGWRWDVRTAEALGIVALDLLRAALSLTIPSGREPWETLRAELRERRGMVHAALGELRKIRDDDIAYWRDRAQLFGRSPQIEEPVETSVREWLDVTLRELPTVPTRIAEVLAGAGPALWRVVGPARKVDPEGSEKLEAKLTRLSVPKRKEPGAAEACLQRLFALAIIRQALAAGQPVLEQTVELVQISAFARNGFDGRELPVEKLAGTQLAHFGAFYKRSWRANDWMWGRLDGAARLAMVLLSPARLRTLGLASGKAGDDLVEHVLDAIEQIALGPDEDAQAVLRPRWNRDAARAELQFLEASDPAAVPKRLPVCAAAIASRIQLEAITEELPHVADSIEVDRDAKAAEPPSALQLMRAVQEARHAAAQAGRAGIAPERAVALFKECDVGKERITGDIGSDHFTGIATTAAAVAVSAAGGKRAGVGLLRTILSPLRGFGLTLYALARAATGRSATEFAALMAMLATGGAIIALVLLSSERLPNVLTALGAVLVLGGVALAALRAGPAWVAGLIVGTVALAVIPYVVLTRYLEPAGWQGVIRDLAPALSIAALVVGSMALGAVNVRSRK